MSEDRTKERVASTSWWPKWEKELSEYINTCEIWQKPNRKHGKNYGLLQQIEELKHAWETINMDCVTGLVPGGKENLNACLIIVERFRKSMRCLPCHKEDTATDTTLFFWNNIISTCGVSNIFISDRDPKLTSEFWTNLYDILEVPLAYSKSQHSATGKPPALVEKGWNPLFPVDHLKKNLLNIRPTAKVFDEMWKRACDTATKCIAEAKEYNKERWDKSHMEPDFEEGDQVENSVEVKLTAEYFRKHPVFPVSLVKPYFHTEEDKFPSRKKNPTPPKMLLNGKDQRQYLVTFKNQTADKDKWLSEDAIPDGNLHLRRFRASRRTEKSHQL
ncbi:hypothetical protein O181_099179 [Austropuccinia psidii MF-1]|uniref:Integrase zinc-binding domain-containing protein n=1 Tax=Austropuccinia psidii MF-1 TaxID=1389203 RepID=A0A9Q3JCR3_9BASI|nr:hypothetical protein [Austropuccinia psidii MF-1]